MTAPSRLIFVNLPVRDLAVSKGFFGALGFAFDAKFTDDSCACMVVSEQAYVMLLDRARASRTSRRSRSPTRAPTTEAILCVSAESREDGRRASPTRRWRPAARPPSEPMDHGFMYGRSFHDLDGHHWEVMWMSPEAVEQGPRRHGRTAALSHVAPTARLCRHRWRRAYAWPLRGADDDASRRSSRSSSPTAAR